MATLDIPLPDDLRRFVDERARQMHHASPTDYVRALIREDQRKAAQARLEEKLIEGLDSGEPVVVTRASLEALRGELQQHAVDAAVRSGRLSREEAEALVEQHNAG